MNTGRPLVFIERAIPGIEADVVKVDDVVGGCLAAKHLIQLGHRRIGVVAMPLAMAPSSDRVAGVRRALREAGLTLDEDMIAVAQFSEQEGFAAARRLLMHQPRPDALVACSLRLTTGVPAAIRRAELRVPDDVALVGYDDLPWALLCNPPLTVIEQPTRERGRIAAGLLLSRLSGARSNGPVTEVLEPRLLVRQSCGAQSGDGLEFFEPDAEEPGSRTAE